MNTVLLATAVGAGSAIAAAPAGAAATPSSRCLHRGERVLARGAALEVVAHGASQDGQIDPHHVFACRVATKQRRRLAGSAATGTSVEIGEHTLRVAGELVAYERDTQDNANGFSDVIVQRITSHGSTSRTAVSAGFNDGPEPGTYRSIAVAPDGAVAFIAPVASTIPLAVYRCRPWGCANAPAEILDRGPKLDTTSLRRVGRSVVWIRDGVRHTAPLGG